MDKTTEQSAYVATLQYLNRLNRPVSPHELVTTLGKSRVTIHAALRRLTKTGWIIKEGTSPKVYYRAVDPFAKNHPEPTVPTTPIDPNSVPAFITWCKTNRYHVPEIALEYLTSIGK